MKLYRTTRGVLIENDASYYLLPDVFWDSFVNDDQHYEKMKKVIAHTTPDQSGHDSIANELLAPVQSQEIWASGVTYYRSRVGRQEESKESGGGDFYARVYEAERPELFFKAPAQRTVGQGGKGRISLGTVWDVPDPELTLLINKIGR